MKMLYCWRCKMDVPMLDEEEFAIVAQLYTESLHATKAYRQTYSLSLENTPIHELFRPVRDAYARLTGWSETNENAVMHHRISMYGSACEECGKPLRTPHASFCAACGHPRPRDTPTSEKC